MHKLCDCLARSRKFSLGAALLLGSIAADAAVSTYNITANNSYIRERNDVNTELPVVIDSRTSLSGQLSIDTETGELVSATFVLADYNEIYDWNPLGLPGIPEGSATLQYTGETQMMATGMFGAVSDTTISFSGASAWSGDSTLGLVTCLSSSGALGAEVCSSASVSPWSAFDIDLNFTDDFSLLSATANWTDSDSLTSSRHQLQILAEVQEVPLPAAGWMMLSALFSLGVLGNKKKTRVHNSHHQIKQKDIS